MVEKEEIMLEIEEIRQHPERVWSSRDRELGVLVLKEIKREYPEAALCEYMGNYRIPLDASQREEIREMLQEIRERKQEDLFAVDDALRELNVTEKERISDWLDGQIRRKREYWENRDYSSGVSLCDDDADKLQLYKGIETVAEALGIELSSYQVKDRTEYRFRHGGAEIFQLRSTEDVLQRERKGAAERRRDSV